MTGPSHIYLGYVVAWALWRFGVCVSVIAGSVVGLVGHLVIDCFVFEWGPWFCRQDRACKVRGIATLAPISLVYFAVIYLSWPSWWLLVPMVFAFLPDLCDLVGIRFPFHDGRFQNLENTMSPGRTFVVEGKIAIVASLLFLLGVL